MNSDYPFGIFKLFLAWNNTFIHEYKDQLEQ
jgi:hypothetical protein